MASGTKKLLTALAATGNNTHTGVAVGGKAGPLALVFVVEAVGATPTVTYKFQGGFAPPESAITADWNDVAYTLPANDTLATATITVTAVGNYPIFLVTTQNRWYPFFRVITTSNTNVTYHAEAWIPGGS